ncbi:MAG: Hsp20/alpha crystallin family protein [Thermoplasmatota archaeon]
MEMRKKNKEIIEKKEQEKEPYLYMKLPEFDELMDRVRYDLESFFNPSDETRMPLRRMFHTKDYLPVDVTDEGDHFSVAAELPGVRKDNVEVDLDDRKLRISLSKEQEKEEKERDYFLKERRNFSSSRTLTLPDEVIGEKAEGNMENGVLKLKIPKKNPTPKKKPHKIVIE